MLLECSFSLVCTLIAPNILVNMLIDKESQPSHAPVLHCCVAAFALCQLRPKILHLRHVYAPTASVGTGVQFMTEARAAMRMKTMLRVCMSGMASDAAGGAELSVWRRVSFIPLGLVLRKRRRHFS